MTEHDGGLPPKDLGLQFLREPRLATYLQRAADGSLSEVTTSLELRRDPLTGMTGRLAHFQGFHLQRPDLSDAVRDSAPGCPFCPDRLLEVTTLRPPSLAPSGRILLGEAALFPNLSPYDSRSVVVTLTRQHFVPIGSFLPGQIADGLMALQDYFRALGPGPKGWYSLVTWNYMPPAGATQVHAHMQGFSTDRAGNLLEQEVGASRAFRRRTGRDYWPSLVAREESLGERFIARGRHTTWLTAFVSRSVVSDVLVVFPESSTLEGVRVEALAEFARGACATLASLGDEGVAAFNLAFYPAPFGAGQEQFLLHVRISPRIYFNPGIMGSDTTAWHHLLDEPFMVRSPEALAQRLRGALASALPGSGSSPRG
jgi:UDPglucose--hexose-1-phosphate uridylyltransferase